MRIVIIGYLCHLFAKKVCAFLVDKVIPQCHDYSFLHVNNINSYTFVYKL